MDFESTYRLICDHLQQTVLLESTQALLEWDERTGMPEAGASFRAEQVSLLAGLVHQRRTDPQLGTWLNELASHASDHDPHGEVGCNIRQATRDFQKNCKLPQRLVEELSRATVLGQQAWSSARADDDFKFFLPHLETMIRLKKEQAEAIEYKEDPYDALLDEYEPESSTHEIAETLKVLRDQLVPIVKAIAESDTRPDSTILRRSYAVQQQQEFSREVVAQMGFDFCRGRLDETDHPFCTSVGRGDCRITTRYDERFFPTSFFGTLHEAGHGMYDQGLSESSYGLPAGSYVSLGIHESQSRMWENLVGRSLPFWEYFFAKAQNIFMPTLDDVELGDFHFAVNDVRPSLIRVEADEVTYNLHIVIRFELERALLSGDLQPADVPVAWNDAYERDLGIRPTNDADGVLQDIHWSAGLFGYFPTYSLGNLYAAQLFAAADQSIGPLGPQFARGEFGELLKWLRKNVHKPGQRFSAADLAERACGSKLETGPLIRDLKCRLQPLYKIDWE